MTSTSPIETNNVVERLLRTELDQFDDQDDRGDALKVLVNPDGLEAADLIQSLSDRIDVLEDLLVKYGDRVRMATAWPESVQPAIDEAFENASRRASLTQGGNNA